MGSRFTLLPDERFTALGPRLAERVAAAAQELDAQAFASVLDSTARYLIADAFAQVGAHEGTIWLVDKTEEHLIPAFNTGPNADRFVGQFQQSTSRGLISLVYKNGQPLSENAVQRDGQQDRSLDTALGLRTMAMIAVPLYFARRLRGVISCVQVQPAGSGGSEPAGFTRQHLDRIVQLSAVLSRLLDHILIATTVGWKAT